MKNKILLILALATATPLALVQTSCQQAPSARTVEYQTLAIVGQTAKSGMDAATQLLKQGSISVAQWQRVATFYDTQFQPTYAVAVAAAKSDLSSVASPDLLALGTQLASLVAQLTTKPTS